MIYNQSMSHIERKKVLDRFINEENIILITTGGINIDKQNIRFIFHIDPPYNLTNYYLQTNQAGQDGLSSSCYMLYSYNDIEKQKSYLGRYEEKNYINNKLELTEEQILRNEELNAVYSFCEIPKCRKKILLGYLGHEIEACGKCDNCLSPQETFDSTIIVQKALSTILRTGNKFGVSLLINVLLGKETEVIKKNNFQKLSVFGIGKELYEKQWINLFKQLITMGYINRPPKNKGINFNEKSRNILKGKEKIFLGNLKDKYILNKPKKEKIKTRELTDKENEIFNELIQVREFIEEKYNYPSSYKYETLIQMVLFNPDTFEDMSKISGIGDVTLELQAYYYFDVLSKY